MFSTPIWNSFPSTFHKATYRQNLPDTGLVSRSQVQSLPLVPPLGNALQDTSQDPCLLARTVSCPTFQDNAPWQQKRLVLIFKHLQTFFRYKIYFRVAVEIPLALNSTSPKTASTKFTNTRYKHVDSTYLQKLQQLELIWLMTSMTKTMIKE